MGLLSFRMSGTSRIALRRTDVVTVDTRQPLPVAGTCTYLLTSSSVIALAMRCSSRECFTSRHPRWPDRLRCGGLASALPAGRFPRW
jgi:hypothetical protein